MAACSQVAGCSIEPPPVVVPAPPAMIPVIDEPVPLDPEPAPEVIVPAETVLPVPLDPLSEKRDGVSGEEQPKPPRGQQKIKQPKRGVRWCIVTSRQRALVSRAG